MYKEIHLTNEEVNQLLCERIKDNGCSVLICIDEFNDDKVYGVEEIIVNQDETVKTITIKTSRPIENKYNKPFKLLITTWHYEDIGKTKLNITTLEYTGCNILDEQEEKDGHYTRYIKYETA